MVICLPYSSHLRGAHLYEPTYFCCYLACINILLSVLTMQLVMWSFFPLSLDLNLFAPL